MTNRFPFYIVSKGRSEYMITSKALTKLNIKHYIIVEQEDIAKYSEAIKEHKLLATVLKLDPSYKEKYDTCDKLGLTKSAGPGPARNFAWDYSIKLGYSHHWVMDDNIRKFYRLNNNKNIVCNNGILFTVMEDFVLRYKNVAMSGPTYYYFVSRRDKYPPYITNTRIYSCNFIRNDLDFRWRGRYNEDTILSLDMMSKGWCTIQFYIFNQDKMMTQKLKGGNTDEFYKKEGKRINAAGYSVQGTDLKSKMLYTVYPNIVKLTFKYGRNHHHVDYSSFKKNRLIKYPNITINKGINNYGMTLKVEASNG